MPEVTASTVQYPTEDREKVTQALLNIFPGKISASEGEMTVRTTDLSRFKEVIRNHRILDSTRAVLLRGVGEGSMVFQLNKQAAFVSKVSFAEGKVPLGPITVTIIAPDLEALIDEVAPRTVNGEIQ
ncbi:MAG: hypothetical protein NT131_08645 [Methanomassiliicoccales archaeon]|nr:hypothetical protein [Methanomassiliicoccales archaeon]